MSSTSVPFTRVYDNEYYTSSQAALYIGDVLIDEVVSLQYQQIHQKTPIYGYASQLFDATSAGHILVQGQLSINFKEQGYLWAVLRRWHNIDTQSLLDTDKSDPKKRQLAKLDHALTKNKIGDRRGFGGRPIIGRNGTRVSRATIEQVVNGDISKTDRNKFYQSLAGYSTFDVRNPKDKAFEDIVEAFEDEIWTTEDNKELLKQMRNPTNLHFDGFDAFITFGNYANKKANHTVTKIVGIRLTSVGKTITIDGRPITEEYSWIARQIV